MTWLKYYYSNYSTYIHLFLPHHHYHQKEKVEMVFIKGFHFHMNCKNFVQAQNCALINNFESKTSLMAAAQ
jgi:hypothetical protein